MQRDGSPNMSLSLSPKLKHRALTLALAFCGVGIFLLLGLPLPFLFGPMSACLLAALIGLPLIRLISMLQNEGYEVLG